MLCIILLSFIIAPTLGARILGVAPIPSYSHQIVFRPLWRELSLRGHQVTVLTADPMHDSLLTNLTEIDLHFSYYDHFSKYNLVNMSQSGTFSMLNLWVTVASDIIEQQLQHSEVQALIKNESEHFDLVMIECIYPGMYAFAERFKAPFIGLFSLDGSSDAYELVGNPTHPVLYPDFMLPYSEDLTFLERVTNTLMSVVVKFYLYLPLSHTQDLLIKKYFGEGYSSSRDIIKNVSLIFVNTDLIFNVRPLIPTVIPFGGGTHMTASKPLPKDLQNQLDSASQGVIYFSLGSNVKSKDLSENTLTIILETLSELPYLILWKFENENLPGKSDNVIISKWFPQQDVLRHPNIKLFISQGGLQSIEEAIYNHIPIVGMPFIGDQSFNVRKIVKKGFGLSVDYSTLDKQSFKSTIIEVITNPKYRNRVKELVELVKDQPMTGLQRAIWWTEYVLRHKGAQHLKSPAADIPLYQYLLLDVIGFCLLVVVIAIYLLVLIFKCIVRIVKCFSSKNKVKVQ